jgi:hypothetical protein
MSKTPEPADESKDVNHDAEERKEIINEKLNEKLEEKLNEKLEDKSPSNIFLINKQLNPMLGIPMLRNTASEYTSRPDKNSKDIISVNKILNEVRKEDLKKVKKSFQRGIVTRGYDFVKEGLKRNRKKN